MNYHEDDSGLDLGRLEQQLAALPVPAMPADLAARCRTLIAANDRTSTSGVRNSRSRRFILPGSLLAVAVAAAMVMTQFGTAPEYTVPLQASRPGAVADAAEAQQAAPAFRAPAVNAANPGKVAAAATPVSVKPFSVRVQPLENGAQDVSSRVAVETFYVSLIDRLHAVPGLTLITAQSTGVTADAPAAYEITVRGYGSVSTGKWNVELKARALSADESHRVLAVVPFSVQGGGGESCAGDQGSTAARLCTDPASMASSQVDAMRKILFPADPGVSSRLQSQLLDSSLDPASRLRALTELRSPRLIIPADADAAGAPARLAAPALDDAALDGALDLAATAPDPVTRASVWRALRGIRNPALVPALGEAVRHDDSEEVSLQAVTMLTQDFPADPRAVSALQSATQEHPRQLVRMIAQRTLTGGTAGDALWRNYVIDTMKNTSLPAGQRLDPFIYMVGADRTPDVRNVGAFLDEAVLQALVTVLPSVWSSGRDGERLARPLVNALQLAKSPAVVDLYAEILRHAIDPMTRSIAVRVLAREYRNDPRTRSALEMVAASDPNPELRKIAGDTLQQHSGPAQ